MPAQSLRTLATEKAKRNWWSIEDVGDSPYELVKPILAAIRDPQQLRRIEISSPHIADFDEELWRAFIARDIPNWRKKLVEPRNPRSWWKVHRKMVREEEKLMQESEERLRESLMGIDNQREANKVNIMTQIVPEPGSRRRTIHAYGPSSVRYTDMGGQSGSANTTARMGQSIMHKVRKEGAASAAAQKTRMAIHKKNQSLLLAHAKSKIKDAPISMLRDRINVAPQAAALKDAAEIYGIARPRSRLISTSSRRIVRPVTTNRVLNSNSLADQPKKGTDLAREPSLNKISSSVTSHSKTSGMLNSADHTRTDNGQSTGAKPSPTPSISDTSTAKKRPVTSIFMPAKKRR